MSQGELFPFLAPETVLAYCRQLERRVLAVSPELSPSQCQRLLGELAIVHHIFDRIERDVVHSHAYRQRQQVRPHLAPTEMLRLNRWPDVALARLAKKPPRWARRHDEHAVAPCRDDP